MIDLLYVTNITKIIAQKLKSDFFEIFINDRHKIARDKRTKKFCIPV